LNDKLIKESKNLNRVDRIEELVDKVYVRLEYLERIIARASCSGRDGWKYSALDLLEQVYDVLSAIKKELEEAKRTYSNP
jgi:HEAT repeat protein